MRSIQAERAIKEFHQRSLPREVVLRDQEHDHLPFDRVLCPDLVFIGRAWLDLPREAGEALPSWETFRPSNFKSVLTKLCVLQVEDWRADRLEFSVYGSHATDFIGGGRPLVMQELRRDPARAPNYIDIRDRAGRAIDNKAPQYVRKSLSWNAQSYIEYETLMLPFMEENGIQRVLQPVSARIQRCHVRSGSQEIAPPKRGSRPVRPVCAFR